MKFTSIVLACSIAASAAAMPTFPSLANLPNYVPKSWQTEAQRAREGNSCNVSTTAQPQSTLPPPDSGLKVAMIALGKGTQNYTCPSTKNSSAVPAVVGALATLYDISCMANDASSSPKAMDDFTTAAYYVPEESPLYSTMPKVGQHYYVGAVPNFFLNNGLGSVAVSKNATAPAPSTAQNAVPWLKLRAAANQKATIVNVFRLQTNNGAAPATCGNITGPFEVPYTAQYWFYVPQSYGS